MVFHPHKPRLRNGIRDLPANIHTNMAHKIFSIPQVHGSPLPLTPRISPRRIDLTALCILFTITNRRRHCIPKYVSYIRDVSYKRRQYSYVRMLILENANVVLQPVEQHLSGLIAIKRIAIIVKILCTIPSDNCPFRIPL